jgi:hypothetical protein
MRQPPPSGVSLNDCLLKGPPALADLYTVTLGIQEHKVAFTKDISKFYQCVEADEAAQHVRRILWRFGDRSKEPTIFVTTRVNYGDQPAGCIAIAAVRETVDCYGKGKETAAWFLMNRTYVDDATGRVAEPKLFDLAPAPAPTIKKFPLRLPLRSRLRLQLELCGCLFSQLLNEKVNFS